MKILLIEDDKEIVDFISKGMKQNGHDVTAVIYGKDGLSKASTEKYDVIITDRMLPGLDGLTIIKTLRANGNKTPILILSTLGDVDDRVKGLRSGSDDYLIKPFAFAELLARVEILEKRNNIIDPSDIKLGAEDLEMDLLKRTICRSGKEIELQSREFELLEYMLRNKGQIVTRTMLLENVWDYNFDPQTNIIDVHISRLRNKIDKGFDKPIIRTVRGAGFIVDDI